MAFGIFYIFLFILDIATAVIMIVYGAWFISAAVLNVTTNASLSSTNASLNAANAALSATNSALSSSYVSQIDVYKTASLVC